MNYFYMHVRAFPAGAREPLIDKALLGCAVRNIHEGPESNTWFFEFVGREGVFEASNRTVFAKETPQNREALDAYIQADRNVHVAETERLTALNQISMMGDI